MISGTDFWRKNLIPINTQAPQKSERHPAGYLWIHSIFHTIQGEGPYVGTPSVFVRLAGCNLQCPGCDTEYTKGAQLMSIHRIKYDVMKAWFGEKSAEEAFRSKKVPLIVITGGEPFRQNLGMFVQYMVDEGFRVQIETNGTLWHKDENHHNVWWDDNVSIVCSPKAGKVVIPSNLITAFKYVLDADHIDPADGLPTSVLGMPAAPARPSLHYQGEVFVQPAEEYGVSDPDCDIETRNELNVKVAVKSAMDFGYRLCLQVHKVIDMQ